MGLAEVAVNRVILAHSREESRGAIREALPGDVEVVGVCGTCAELRSHYRDASDAIVISGVSYPDGDGIETLVELGGDDPHPAVIVTDRRSLEIVEKATQDHVMAYLLEPVDEHGLTAAMVVAKQRHVQLRELQEQVEELGEALRLRRWIEQAKGVLMGSRGISEVDAYVWLRTEAQKRRTTIVDLARDVIEQHAAKH